MGAGATVALAAVLVWSGVDTLSARDAYLQNPTEAGYNDGVGRETRTNVLVGVTAGLGVATLVCATLLTDWSGGRATPTVAALPGGAQVGWTGSF